MIDITLLRGDDQTRQKTKDALERRGVANETVDNLYEIDQQWITLSAQVEKVYAEKHEATKKIVSASKEEKQSIIEQMQEVGEHVKQLETKLVEITKKRDQLWRSIPNIPLSDVQVGGEDDFVVVATSTAQVKPADQTPKDYATLMGSKIDMVRGAKVSGARFTYFTGDVARLELGIVSYVIDTLTGKGFTQVAPPILLGAKAMTGMGYLDQAGDEVYQTQDDLYLIGTSEQSLGAMYMDEILPIKDLPHRMCAFSPCFRREAGSYGKDVKGILRLHQFDKVEMFSITTPELSEQEHQFLLEQQRSIMDALKLPYRVIRLAAGDLGSPSAKTYDIETWIPSEGKYRETHSTSNTTDYQSRRLNIRYKTTEGKTEKVHMLNGTAVAISRLLIALIENHQQTDGSVAIPAPILPYVPFTTLSCAT